MSPDTGRRRSYSRICEALESRRLLAGDLVITEVVASNTEGLKDQFGNRPDWIEIFNPGDSAVELEGWYLTDQASELTKWQFPAATIAPHELKVVFASGDSITDPDSPLHTNFKLNADGEYVALVEPDGETIASSVAFSEQLENIAYGVTHRSTQLAVVEPNTNARWFVPTELNGGSELGLSWIEREFDDGFWGQGAAAIGFDSAPNELVLTDIKEAMFDVNSSAYVRVPFEIETHNAVDALALEMRYDDGVAVFLNGTEVLTENIELPLQFDSTAVRSHASREVEVFDLTDQLNLLREGDNILALQVANRRANNPDVELSPRLVVSIRDSDVANDFGYIRTPTPGVPNGISTYTRGPVRDIAFSLQRGFYSDPFDLVMTTDPGAEIAYTTDGSEPTAENGTRLQVDDNGNAVLNVSETTVLRAMGIKADHVPGAPSTSTYVFTADVVQQSSDGRAPEGWPDRSVAGQSLKYGMNPLITDSDEYRDLIEPALKAIPSLSIVMDRDDLLGEETGIYVNALDALDNSRDWERQASLELLSPDGTEEFQIDAGIRIRGGASRAGNNPKHAFRLFFRGEYGASKLNFPLFGDEGVKSFDNIDLRTAQAPSWNWCVVNGAATSGGCRFNTFLRDIFTRDTQRDIGQPYTRSEYYHLYLNGQYWGLFQTQERAEASYAASYFGGEEVDYDVIKEEGSIGGTFATDGTIDAWRRLWEASIEGFDQVEVYNRVQGIDTNGERDPELEVLLDVDALIDYMILIFYSGNLDGPTSNFADNNSANNWFGIRNRNGQAGFQFFIHDAEWTLIHPTTNRLGPWPAGETLQQSNPQWIHQRLMHNPEYRLRFADRVQVHMFNDGAMTPEASLQRLEARRQEIELAIIAESARWGSTWRADPYSKLDWEKEVDRIVSRVLPNRTEVVVDQFRKAKLDDGSPAPLYPDVLPPGLNRHGGLVSPGFELTIASPGEVFFTVDGSDPRTSDAAKRYDEPLVIDNDFTLKARTKVGETWSAVVDVTFTVSDQVRLPGDSNGDGRFDSRDLVVVFQAAEYEDEVDGNSTFEEGDWNGDGDFDSSDLVAAFRTGNYFAESRIGPPAANSTDSVFEETERKRTLIFGPSRHGIRFSPQSI